MQTYAATSRVESAKKGALYCGKIGLSEDRIGMMENDKWRME